MAEKVATMKDLKVGSYVMIDGEPCRVVSISFSKPGKHGAAKGRVDAVGIFDEKKRTLMKPADATIGMPIIEKKNAQVVSVSGDIAQLMDMADYSMLEVSIPEEFKGKLSSGMEIEYWQIDNKIMIKRTK
jgi:translation initiation factor 5A